MTISYAEAMPVEAAAALEALLVATDRSDPLAETVLCLVECAVRAASAVAAHRVGDGSEEPLREALGAARAAVVAVSFAMAEDAGTPAR